MSVNPQVVRRKRSANRKVKDRRLLADLYEHSITHPELMEGEYLDEEYLTALTKRYEDALVAQAVNVPVVDALSAWRTFSDEGVQALDDANRVKSTLIEAGIEARVFGKCLVFPVLTDNNTGKVIPFNKPLEKLSNYSVKRVVYTKDFVAEDVKVSDPASEEFNLPKSYRIRISGGKERTIHGSRARVISANRAGTSFIYATDKYYCDLHERSSELTKSVRENNLVVLKTSMELLNKMARQQVLASGDNTRDSVEEVAQAIMQNRLVDLRENADSNNAYGIDKEEEELSILLRTNINQITGTVDNAAKMYCSAVDIPATRFLGYRIQGGLAGDNDDLIYSQTLTGLREYLFNRPLELIDRVMAFSLNLDSISYEWNPFVFQEITSPCGEDSGSEGTDEEDAGNSEDEEPTPPVKRRV